MKMPLFGMILRLLFWFNMTNRFFVKSDSYYLDVIMAPDLRPLTLEIDKVVDDFYFTKWQNSFE